MRVLAFGSYDGAKHPRIAVLVEGLRARGVTVDEVNVPLQLDTAQRVQALQEPWRLPLVGGKVAGGWAKLALRARRVPKPDAVLVGYLGHVDVLLAKRLFPDAPIVHDMLVFGADTAKDRGAGGAKQVALARLDKAAIAASDVLVMDTEEHRQLLPARKRVDAVVVPVGAPRAWFAPEPQARTGTLKVVFFGLFTPLQAAPVVARALALIGSRATGIEVTMVGHGQDLEECKRVAGDLPWVTWRDWVEPAELPGLVAGHDVCLGVFAGDGKGARVVPNKVFQGAAAGCAVVTADTPPQRRLLGDHAVLVPPGDPRALAGALYDLAVDPEMLLGFRRAAWELAQAHFTPEAVVGPLLARLELGV